MIFVSSLTIEIYSYDRFIAFLDIVFNALFVLACSTTDTHFPASVLYHGQLRIHDTVKTDFYLHVQSGPIIERSTEVRFAPNNYSYDQLAEHIEVREQECAYGMCMGRGGGGLFRSNMRVSSRFVCRHRVMCLFGAESREWSTTYTLLSFFEACLRPQPSCLCFPASSCHHARVFWHDFPLAVSFLGCSFFLHVVSPRSLSSHSCCAVFVF